LFRDPPAHSLPVGAWSACMNVRFNDGYIERIREPELELPTADAVPAEWAQQYIDSNGIRVIYATAEALWRRSIDGNSWEYANNTAYPSYTGGGTWQSFAWGNAVVFNNGIDPPQILFDGTNRFVDLPGWGLISSDPNNPTQDIDTGARCKVIRPYLNYMVAIGVTALGGSDPLADGENPNAVWHSAPATDPSTAPSWDYADPSSGSQVNIVAIEDGPLVDMLPLNNRNILYTTVSAHSMTLTNTKTFPFAYDRVLENGITSMNAVAAFNNLHFCVSTSTVYVHDGSTVTQIADGKMQETFIDSLNAGEDDENPRVQCVNNKNKKEIHVLYRDRRGGGSSQSAYLIYNYKDNNFSQGQAYVTVGQAGVGGRSINDAVCFMYGFDESDTVTWAQIESEGKSWSEWFATDTSWASLQQVGFKQKMFWMTAGGLYEAERREVSDENKLYFVERYGIDLSELNPQMTSNRWKHLRQLYPHVDTVNQPEGVTESWSDVQFTVGWTDTLLSKVVNNKDIITYDTLQGDYKVDVRTTGRYLYFRMDALTDGFFRFTSMDYDVELQQRR
jgi:hypothetical protein